MSMRLSFIIDLDADISCRPDKATRRLLADERWVVVMDALVDLMEMINAVYNSNLEDAGPVPGHEPYSGRRFGTGASPQ